MNIVSDYTDSKLRINNLKGLLVTDYDGDDLEKSANDLFGFIVRFLFNQYTGKKDSLKVTSCSNFFKNDKVYEEVILKEIDSVDDYDREKLDKLMELFSKKKVI